MKLSFVQNIIIKKLNFNLFLHFLKSYRRRTLKLAINLTLGLILVLGFSSIHQPVVAQINLAVIQEILDGNQVFIEKNQAKVQDKANFGQIILTKDSRAGILFNNGAAGRLGSNASVAVGQCVEVQQGTILVSGPINGCMAGISVAVQGTIYVLEKTEENSGNIKVIEGEVQVTPQDGSSPPVTVKEGEKVDVLQGILGQIVPMSPEELVALLNGQLFTGFQIPVTAEGALQSACSRLLPGLSCSTTGLPSYPIPTPPIPIPLPGLPF
ncbi:MAG: hypothetical protein VKJ02_07795 [Snowella sp.]|nr:hypothetical protein [Snowella sp.]